MNIECIETGICYTDTYLIVEGDEAIVIDPGDDFETIYARLAKLGATAKYVLITHGHFDHIGAVARFKASGAKVYISKTDYDMFVKPADNVNTEFFGKRVEQFAADVLVSDGDKFMLCNHDFTVISTPGHTPGGVCYVMDDSCIFSGDTLFRLSIGRTDFPLCSHSDLIKSIKRLFALNGDYTVYPGHGKSTTLDFERKNNPYVG
ncbi:MAG: MBL fold metallo-hydrolase [Clostridiales bacterium]|nr:MBL fold metallo-hydrolase [Clostridiales bacterium]